MKLGVGEFRWTGHSWKYFQLSRRKWDFVIEIGHVDLSGKPRVDFEDTPLWLIYNGYKYCVPHFFMMSEVCDEIDRISQ